MSAFGDPFMDESKSSSHNMRQMNNMRRAPQPYDTGYGSMNAARFAGDMPLNGARYDSVRDAFNQNVNVPAVNNPAFPYDLATAHTWNAPSAGSMPAFGMNGIDSYGSARNLKSARPRADLSSVRTTTFFNRRQTDQYQHFYDHSASVGNAPTMPRFGSNNALQEILPRRDLADGDDELIPTAIVIKNIPFAVKKEQLQGLMTDMHLPLPYAFNYHFDNGVFRGLAFANFTSAEETAIVIRSLNHMEINGRKLRVEYKKMLPATERERIEREKRERRGQLEEQHRPMPPNQLQSQVSLSSLASHMQRNTPSPASQGGVKPGK